MSQIDFCQHLEANYSLLMRIQEAVKLDDREKIFNLVQSVDWESVNSEFESAVRSYRNEVYRLGRRIIRNLLKPYYLYYDTVNLKIQMDMLRGAIRESPSLMETQGEKLERAYQTELRNKVLHDSKGIITPDKCPWLTVQSLFYSANNKLHFAYALEINGNEDYRDGRRVYESGGHTDMK